jgi:hypothetical protein
MTGGIVMAEESIDQFAKRAGLVAAAEVMAAASAGKILEPRTWFNQQQAADYLGISEPTLCLYVKARCAPESKKIGHGRRYHRADLDTWILNGGVDAFPGVDLNVYGRHKQRRRIDG